MTQKEALDILKLGKNVFLTGPAGSGKTYVLNEYIKYLKSNAIDVAVTASTGIAATHIGGMTIHSWSGLGVRDMIDDRDIDDMMQRPYLYKRFEKTKVLIIDEVSMLHHFRLDLIEWICRQFKHNEKSFGGLQVIFCGDFFQLPPVTRGEISESEYAFKSTAWQEAKLTVCYLSEQHRQKDNTYLSILNEIRQNSVSKKTLELLRSRVGQDPDTGVEPTKVHTHNIDVDFINLRHLDLVSGDAKFFQMKSKGSKFILESLKKSCLSPEELILKVGAKVMFTKNHPEGQFVNGSLGVIQEFSYDGPVVRLANGRTVTATPMSWKIEEEGSVKAEITQFPLRLAWAITVHKSQGMSLDAMEVDLSKSFVRGMGYVALSRVRSLGGIKLIGWNTTALEVDPEVLEYDREFQEMSDEAREKLEKMSRDEITKKQNEFLKSIEPEEKVRIKKKEKLLKKSTEEITADMLREEMPLEKIADSRGLKSETIVSHIEKLLEEDKCPDFSYLRREFKRSELDDILSAFKKAGTITLAPVYNILQRQKKKPTYLKIRLARLFLE
ncbi:MAG: AAA family ATPase [bacterium]